MLSRNLVFVLVASCLIGKSVSFCDLDIFEINSRVISSARRHFQSDCVNFIASNDLDLIRQIVSTQRRLSEDGIQSAVIDMDEDDHRLVTSCNRPIYAIFDDEEAKGRLKKGSDGGGRLSVGTWLLFLRSGGFSSEDLDEYFLDVDIPFDCEFVVVAPPDSHGNVALTEVYRIARHLPLQKVPFGLWGFVKDTVWPVDTGLYKRRGDLGQLEFHTTVNEWHPLAIIPKRDPPNNLTTIQGFAGIIWKTLEHQLNFTTIHTLAEGGKWGGLTENGTWDGMVGAILYNQANMSAVALTMTPERFERISFSFPLFVHSIRIYIKQPTRNTHLTNLLSPFSKDLWIAFIISALALSVGLSLLYKLHGHKPFFDISFNIFGAIFCQQGSNQNPRSTCKRTLLFLSYSLGVIVLTSYSCFFISSLTSDRTKLPFNSLRGILKDGSYSVGMVKSAWIYGEFKNADELKRWPLKQLYDRQVVTDPENAVPNVQAGFERMCEKRFVYIVEENTVDFMDVKCEVATLKNVFSKRSIAYGFPKGSPYVGLFNSRLIDLMSGGIIKKHYSDAVRKPHRVKDDEKMIVSVGFKTVKPILSFGAAGVAVSLVALVLENIFFYLCRKYDDL